MEPNYAASIEFLQKWKRGGPWNLSAIAVDRKEALIGGTFTDEGRVLRWLTKYGEEKNLYFGVNPCLRPITDKAGRDNIAALAWLHVDIDPREGEDIDEEQERILGLLTTNRPAGIPPATAVNFSGGGYQGFWKLSELLMLNGDLTKAEDAKLYNLQLEVAFGADPCHNVDRIMRLPGTLNRPNKKKRAKGQRLELAKVIHFNEGDYDLAGFIKAPKVQGIGGGFAAKDTIEISGNVKRFASVEDVPHIDDHCRRIIVQGLNPDEPTKHESRSEWLFYVCCEMVRKGCSNDDIYSVITDKGFNISASVLEHPAGPDYYAKKQIRTAKEMVSSPELCEMNERHAAIFDVGGKFRIATERYDPALGRDCITFQEKTAFFDRYANRLIQVGVDEKDKPKYMPLGLWWFRHSKRREYESVVFAPEREAPGQYNLWQGFACASRPGDCSLFLDHLKTILCAGVQEHYNYLIGWMARAIQYPWKNGQVAVVMRGKQGTGKGFFAEQFGALWGRHYLHISDQEHLVGRFNAHFMECAIIFADEAVWAGNRKQESILKALITETTVAVEKKGIDLMTMPNCLHVIMASNEHWVFPAGPDDRRFFALDVPDARKEDHEYFTTIKEQLDSGGREALLHYLRTYNIDDFNVRKVPKTEMLREQKHLTMRPEELWWHTNLQEGTIAGQDWDEIVTHDVTYDFSLNVRRVSPRQVGAHLRRFCPKLRSKQYVGSFTVTRLDGREQSVNQIRKWIFPPLEECRKHWDDNFGGPYDWDLDIKEQEDVPF